METKIIEINPHDPRLLAFNRLLNIMDDLREKCPWDKKQTLESLRHLTIEETYELAEAITAKDLKGLEGEIGDLLLHMVFYAKIGSELGAFDITSVLNTICDKLVHRHPHIYSNVVAEDEETVKANWEKLKLSEGKKSVLEGVPSTLPALIKAMRIQEKVKGIGFDWNNIEEVKAKIVEELEEFWQAQQEMDQEEVFSEFGDVLFSMINYGRFLDLNPEDALEHTNRKFISRFQLMEKLITLDHTSFQDLTLEQMDTYWNKAKELLRKK